MLEIRLLGEQQVMAAGTSIQALRSPRTLGLLAYLVLHAGVPQLRSSVARQFWPDSTEAQARTNLRRELHQLRTAIPDPKRHLGIDAKAVYWLADTPARVDLLAFRTAVAEARAAMDRGDDAGFLAAAEHAVRAYGGELLPGLYDNWVLEERERLHRECVAMLDQLATMLAEQGQAQAAVGYALRRVELEPFEESGYRMLMALQAEAGDRAAALHTYHRCTTALEHEIGVAPCAETVAVYHELFPRPPDPVPAPPASRRAVPLVGRTTELALLEAAWAQMAEGPGLAVIAGEAGVGKTRVAAEFAHAVQRGGGVVARARCFAAGGWLAFAPVAEWLRSPALRRGLEQLDPAWRAEAGRLMPELGPGDRPTRPVPLADAWQRRQFFEGLVQAVLASGQPTLLVLDDLQWCDSETLAWLEFLLHFDAAAPLLVVATLRSEELDDNAKLVACRRRLRARGMLQEFELAPLDAQETAELAAVLYGRPLDDVETRKLLTDTGGFPLFVIESQHEDATGSSRIEAVLAGRLERLSPDAGKLAGLAAAVGRDFSLELLATAGDLDEATLVAAVDELWHRRLLREHSPTTYDFAHDVLRDAAYERITPPHRRLLHQRIAAALEQRHADNAAAQIAEQYERGALPARAIHFHALAADANARLFAYKDAVGHYERALELLADLPAEAARDQRELVLCEAMVPSLLALCGYADPRLGALLEHMTELGVRLDDPAMIVRSQAALSAHLAVQGRIHESAELTQRLMPRVADHPDQKGQICVARGWSLTSLGQLHDALEQFDLLEEQTDAGEVSPLGFPVRVLGLGWRAHSLWLVGRAREAAASTADALELADRFGHPFTRAIALGYGAITHRLLDDVEGTVELAISIRTLCERYGFAYYGDWGRILEGWAIGGSAGEKLIREGLAGLQSQHAGRARPFWLSLLAEVLAGTGRTREASWGFAQARDWAEKHGDRWWLAELWRLNAALSDGTEAEAMLERALGIAREQGAVALELRTATDVARRWIESGRAAEAAALLAPVRAQAAGCNPADLAAADALVTDTTT